VIAERTKDGAIIFHDPKLDADLSLLFEQIKIVRGMEGHGWFANVIFHDKWHQCPLLALFGHSNCTDECPLSGVKRT
jgi:hypothetical protein